MRPLAAPSTAIALAALCAACPAVPPEATSCNFDTDCKIGQECRAGFCGAASVDAGTAPELDAGPADAGDVGDAGTTGCDAGSHDGGDGICVPNGTCSGAFHDGGDGTCVTIGACSAGFARFFVDGDGDGHGTGAQRDTCDASPPGVGFAAIGDDCDDANPTVFVSVSGFDDADHDTYTSGPVSACTDGSLPDGVLLLEHLAPIVLIAASTNGGSGSSSWSSSDAARDCCGGVTIAPVDPGVPTAILELTEYACAVVPRRVENIVVHTATTLESFSALPPTLPVAATLIIDGVPGATLQAQLTFPILGSRNATIAGTPTDWGFPSLTPNALCDGNTTLRLQVLDSGTAAVDVGIDFATLEVDGADDCAPTTAANFVAAIRHADDDNDGDDGPGIDTTCSPALELDEPRHGVIVDCDDTDDRAHTGQSGFFTAASNGGTFDYNCNGSITKRAVSTVASCSDPADGTCTSVGATSHTGACGELEPADSCPAAPPCNLVAGNAKTACH